MKNKTVYVAVCETRACEFELYHSFDVDQIRNRIEFYKDCLTRRELLNNRFEINGYEINCDDDSMNARELYKLFVDNAMEKLGYMPDPDYYEKV